MSENSPFDLDSAAASLIVFVVMIAVLIHLIPALLQVAWQVLPGILTLWFVAAVLRSMVKKLPD
jgi:hypothetical protein